MKKHKKHVLRGAMVSLLGHGVAVELSSTTETAAELANLGFQLADVLHTLNKRHKEETGDYIQ